jgi:tyrosyl-tRNA synthetase
MFFAVFEGVPQYHVTASKFEEGIHVVELLAEETNIFASKGEARRMLKDNGVSVNKVKISDSAVISSTELINDQYLLIQKGKKNYYVVLVH